VLLLACLPRSVALALTGELVRTDKKKWVTDARFLEVLSIASALPGPSSTQTIASMGLFRAGPLGGLVALVFWMLPAWVVMTAAGIGAKSYLQGTPPSLLQ
jgi:chromate transporter